MTIRFTGPGYDGKSVAATPARPEPRPAPSVGRPLPLPPRPSTPFGSRVQGLPSALPAQSTPSRPSNGADDAPALKLVVRGFNAIERNLLEGTVRLSQRRTPRLQLLAEADVESADVVMIDAADSQATQWAQRQTSLAAKAVIWVDGSSARSGHTLVRRPVQWPILPMLLARALEKGPAERAPATVSRGVAAAVPASPAFGADVSTALPILVVDDSLAVRNYLRSQLEARGFRVAEAASAQAAIDAVATTAFACVLMDVLMPGIDGYEGCKQIKARTRGLARLPVIMLTSKSSPFDRIRGKMAGCDAYLTKPVEPAQLHDVLAQHAGRPVRN